MQLQGIMLLFILLIMSPILLLSSNHNLFFILVGAVLLFTSVKNIFDFSKYPKVSMDEEEEEMLEDIEVSSGLNINRVGSGIKIVLNLIIILFFIYCSFYIRPFWAKIVIALSILYRVFDINFCLKYEKPQEELQDISVTNKLLFLSSNIFTVFIILVTVFFKFLKSPL